LVCFDSFQKLAMWVRAVYRPAPRAMPVMPRNVGVCFDARNGRVVAARKESASYSVVSGCADCGC
jgi:hypothetical protein